MTDLFDKLLKNRGPLGMHSKESYGYFMFPKLEGPISNKMIFRGKEKLVWSLNNYLSRRFLTKRAAERRIRGEPYNVRIPKGGEVWVYDMDGRRYVIRGRS